MLQLEKVDECGYNELTIIHCLLEYPQILKAMVSFSTLNSWKTSCKVTFLKTQVL